jgi:RNA polymerase sigma factor (sigma-70 family)
MGVREQSTGPDEHTSLLSTLLELHYETILRFLTRLAGSVGLAEELAQTCCLGLLKSWRPSGRTGDDRRYVLRSAYNTWCQWIKRQASKPSETSLDDLHAPSEECPLEVVASREEITLVREALDDLPPRYRAVIVLIVLEGMSYTEVAELMATSRNTVAKWRTRAMWKIAERLSKGLGYPEKVA